MVIQRHSAYWIGRVPRATLKLAGRDQFGLHEATTPLLVTVGGALDCARPVALEQASMDTIAENL